MKAVINQTGETIQASSLHGLRNVLIRRMVQSGMRGYTAVTRMGTTIHVSLYDGDDYIQTRTGRNLLRRG